MFLMSALYSSNLDKSKCTSVGIACQPYRVIVCLLDSLSYETIFFILIVSSITKSLTYLSSFSSSVKSVKDKIIFMGLEMSLK